MQRVFINKKTGDLFIAWQIMFIERSEDIYALKGYSISMTKTNELHWLIFNPLMSPFAIYFNEQCRDMFEDLGEL